MNVKHLSMRGARPSLRLTRAAGLLLAVVLPLLAAEVAKATDRFTTDSLQYQHSWTVPEGVIAATAWLCGAPTAVGVQKWGTMVRREVLGAELWRT